MKIPKKTSNNQKKLILKDIFQILNKVLNNQKKLIPKDISKHIYPKYENFFLNFQISNKILKDIFQISIKILNNQKQKKLIPKDIFQILNNHLFPIAE